LLLRLGTLAAAFGNACCCVWERLLLRLGTLADAFGNAC